MDQFMGFLIAAFATSFALYAFLQGAIFHRIIADRFTSRVLAGLTTYVVSVLVYGIGASETGEFRFEGFLIFLVPSAITLALATKVARGERSGGTMNSAA